MSHSEPPATPGRLARISAAQAVGAITETVVFGAFGIIVGFTGLVFASVIGIPLADSFGRYLVGSTGLLPFIVASGVMYVALLIAFRTRLEAGLESPLGFEKEEPETKVERAIETLTKTISVSSYTAAVIVIGGVLAFESTSVSPVFGMVALAGYPYFEHSVMIESARDADTLDDVSTPMTPGLFVAAMIALVMMFIATPILISLEAIGLIASMQRYMPSLEAANAAIRETQEHLMFIDRLIRPGRRAS